MQMSLVLALGAGKAAMATQMFQNGTNTASASALSMPETVGEFKFLACASDKENFANLQLVAQSPDMSLNLCAASCPSKYFATSGDGCHCGETIPADMSTHTPETCALPCPGDDKEACGGSVSGSAPAATSAAAAAAPAPAPVGRRDGGKICTIYVRNSESSIKTKYEINIHTITACPATVTDCPAKPYVTTVTKTYTTEVCPAPEWHKKKIVCYGPNCAPEYPCDGQDCKRERVICRDDDCWTEECDDDEDWTRLVIYKSDDDCTYANSCWGDDCSKKIVCYDGKCVIEKCYGDECKKNLVCDGDECRYAKCDDRDNKCYQKFVCPGGKDCKVVELCKGDNYTCPKPALPINKPGPRPGPQTTAAPGPNQNTYNKGNYGDNNNNNGWNKDNNGWNKDCNGYDCRKGKPTPGGTASNTMGPRPTMPPMVGGAERNAVGVVGALAGIAFLL